MEEGAGSRCQPRRLASRRRTARRRRRRSPIRAVVASCRRFVRRRRPGRATRWSGGGGRGVEERGGELRRPGRGGRAELRRPGENAEAEEAEERTSSSTDHRRPGDRPLLPLLSLLSDGSRARASEVSGVAAPALELAVVPIARPPPRGRRRRPVLPLLVPVRAPAARSGSVGGRFGGGGAPIGGRGERGRRRVGLPLQRGRRRRPVFLLPARRCTCPCPRFLPRGICICCWRDEGFSSSSFTVHARQSSVCLSNLQFIVGVSLSNHVAIARHREDAGPPPPPRRHMHDAPESVKAKLRLQDAISGSPGRSREPMRPPPTCPISKLNEEQRAQLSKRLDKMSKELDGKLVQELDTYLQRPTFYNDQGKVNRVLNFCRVPKGERREKLIWRSNLAIFFVTSWAIGQWVASRCMQYHYEYQKKQGEETANHAA